MKKYIHRRFRSLFLAVLCCGSLVLGGCDTKTDKYKRICFDGEVPQWIGADTTVTDTAEEKVPAQLPIYEIRRRYISNEEFKQMEEQLGITRWEWNEFDGLQVYSRVAGYSDPVRGPFSSLNLTEEEVEELAWETFNKIPFLTGEYEYIGETGRMTESSEAKGEYVTELTVSFYRTLDGICVVGNDQCDLTFDAKGLVEVYIKLFDYQKVGTMDLVPLEEARGKIKTPDSVMINAPAGVAENLHVQRVQPFWVNQYSKGCTILQPIYTFYGTATFGEGTQAEFRSRIIAIPEAYTYEEE